MTGLKYLKSKCSNAALIAALAAFAVGGANAQPAEETPPPATEAAPSSGPIEVVTVTAQKYETVLQSTPLAIDVFTGEALNTAGIDNTADLSIHAPSFVMNKSTVQNHVYIRGIGTDISSISADMSVAVLIDGVYLPRISSALQDFNDIARVEIVKGPQGTLYGRNATGGVVSIVTELPTDELTWKADILLGDHERARVRGSVSGPLSDTVTARLSLMRHRRDGYVENLLTGNGVDDVDNWAGRAMLRWQPNENVDVIFSIDGTTADGAEGSAIRILGTDSPALFFGGTVTSDPHKIFLDGENHISNDQGGASVKIIYDDGPATYTSITAYRQSRFKIYLDLDGTQANWFIHDPDTQYSKTFSQEFQATAEVGDWRWTAGFYYFSEDAESDYNLFLPLVGFSVRRSATNETSAYAAFAEVTYSLNDRLSLTGGLRYSYEEKDATVQSYQVGIPNGSFAGGDDWAAFTPKFGIQYQATDDIFIYASATRGFKSGGFNSTAIQTPQGFDPEFVWSYEAGIKTMLWDGRMRFNATAFYYDYTDLQVNKYDAVNIVTLENAADATIKGLEFEVEVAPTDDWHINANVALLDTEYVGYLSVDPDAPPGPPVDVSGNSLTRAPEVTYAISSDYTFHIGDAYELNARGEYYYRSKAYFSPFNKEYLAQDGFGLWNASLRLEPTDGNWYVSVFGRNLSDEVYYVDIARSAPITGTVGYVAEPRTYGIEIGLRY